MDAIHTELANQRDKETARANRYLGFLTQTVHALGDRFVATGDEGPHLLKIEGNVLTTERIRREFPVVTGKDLGAGIGDV